MANKTEYELLLEMAAKLDPSYRTAMESARKGVQDVGDEAKDSADDIGVMDIAMGNLVANGISALISAGAEAAKSIYGMAEETREFRQDMATLETAFADAGFTVETATDTWENLYAIFGEDDRAVEAANNISRMAKSEEELNDWVTITTGIWGKYQDALPVEGLAEAAGETAKVGQITGVLADALNWGAAEGETFGVVMKANTKKNEEWNKAVKEAASAEDYFNLALQECTTEAERQALINSTLLRIYGSAADQYEETAGNVMDANRAQADYLQTQAAMGAKIEPITTAVKQGVTDLMNAALQLLSDVDLAAWAGKIESGFSWFANTGLPFLIDNLPTLATVLGGVTTAIIAQTAANKIKTITDLAAANGMSVMALAQKALNAAMSANPIGLIITGITLLVGAFVALWNNCEGFRNFFIGMWEQIKAGITPIINMFKTYLLPVITAVWDNIKARIASAWGFITAAFSNAVNTIKGYVNGIIQVFKGIVSFFTGIFSGDMSKAAEGLSQIFDGIKAAWSSIFKGAANAVINVLNWLIDKINLISIGPLPNWSILGDYAGAEIGFNIPKIPLLANGGIATGPTLAMVGEGTEDEAILPLSKLGSLMGDTESTSIVYSPNITVMPGASGGDVKEALSESFEQFKAYMDRYLREKKRLQFS